MRKLDDELSALAESIARKLIAEGFIVQRYGAYTTSSIYLKLDYGVCNSIRISDHNGKKHLKYRYNIGPFVKEFRTEKDKYDRFYYRADKAKNMLKRIIEDREFKKARYGESGYRKLMQKNKSDNANSPGFWKKAVLLNKGV